MAETSATKEREVSRKKAAEAKLTEIAEDYEALAIRAEQRLRRHSNEGAA